MRDNLSEAVARYVVIDKTSVYSMNSNPDFDDHIYKCLLMTMAVLQAEDVTASFLSKGDLNDHHQEWLGYITTNCPSVTALDCATVSGCDQLVIGPTHARGGTS